MPAAPGLLSALVQTIECLDLGIAIFDHERRLVHSNAAFRANHGLPSAAVRPGTAFADLIRAGPEGTAYDGRPLADVVAPGLDRSATTPGERVVIRRADGQVLETRSFPLDRGGFVTTCRAIAQQGASEEALGEPEGRFRDFASSGSEWFWEMGADLRFTWLSDQFTPRTGLPQDRVLGRTRWEAAEVELPDPAWTDHVADLQAHRPFRDFRYLIRDANGGATFIGTSGVPVFGAGGDFLGYRGTGINRTAEVLAERAAAEAQNRLLDAIESITEGFALFDAEDRLVLCNENYRNGLSRVADILEAGVTWERLFRTLVARGAFIVPEGEDREAWLRDRLAEHGGPRANRSLQTTGGRWIEVREYPTRDGGRVIIRTDASERKRADLALRESEERFRDFASASSDWFWEMGPDLRFTWISDQFQALTGIDARRVIGHARDEFGEPIEASDDWSRHLADLEARRPFRNFRYCARTDDGETLYFSTNGVPVYDARGRFRGYRGSGTNITASIIAEQRAAAAHARLLDAVEHIPEGFVLWDRNDRLVLCNSKFKELYVAAAELLTPGASFTKILEACAGRGTHLPDGPDVAAWLARRLAFHTNPGTPFEQNLSDGRCVLVLEQRTSDGGIAGVHIDITPLKAREAALRASQESLANAQRIAHIGNWDLDVATSEFVWSDEIFRIFGHAPQSFRPTYGHFLDAVHPDDRGAVERAIDATLYCDKPYSLEHRVVRPDGTERWVEQEGEVTFGDDGRPRRMTGTVQDITERKLAEIAYEKAEERFRLAFETNPEAVTISRLDDGLYIDVNKGYEILTGLEHDAVVGKRAVDLGFWADPGERDRTIERLRRDGALNNVEITICRADGERRAALASARILDLDGVPHVLAVTKDISELKRAEQELRKLFRAVEDSAAAVIITDTEGVIEYVNRRFTEVTGFSREDAVGRTPRLLKSGELSDEDYRELWSTIRSGRTWRGEFRNRRKNGSLYWASALISPVRMPDGAITHFVGIQEDITDRKRAEAQLRASEERFRGLVEGSVLGIVIDRDGRPLFVNETYARMFGYASPEDILALPSLDALYAPSDLERIRRYRRARLEGMYAPDEYEFRGVRRDGSLIWVRAHLKVVPWNGRDAVQSTVVDITLRKHYEERLHYQANFDPVTDLPNRTLALDRLDHAVANARRHRSGLAVLFIDVDHFKKINDTLGHALGDRFLREAAHRIKACLREQDTVARLGGDEFTVILPDVRSGKDGEAVARKILDGFARPFVLDTHETFSSASIGIAVWPQDGTDPETLMRNADAAMYQAKERGRSTVHFFTHELNERALERIRMENHLRRGLEGNEFKLLYQPLVDLRSGRFAGAEALLRWDSPALGAVTPDRFIRLAENTGLIVPIGEWVLATACRQLRQWQDEGVGRVALSLNISSRQFRAAMLADAVAAALAGSGIAPQSLELEITEGAMMEDLPQTQAMIADLKALGVRLAIDDFGTGYSSLSYLGRFAPDTLKIDKSFIGATPVEPANAALVEAMIAMAHGLGMRVVAEGVERREHLEFLRSRGCDLAQGYFIGRPVAANDLADLVRSGAPIIDRGAD